MKFKDHLLYQLIGIPWKTQYKIPTCLQKNLKNYDCQPLRVGIDYYIIVNLSGFSASTLLTFLAK